jgi:hypothetical protein
MCDFFSNHSTKSELEQSKQTERMQYAFYDIHVKGDIRDFSICLVLYSTTAHTKDTQTHKNKLMYS